MSVEIITECKHGKSDPDSWEPSTSLSDEGWCTGGSRRVLEPGSFVLVEKAEDGEWKDEDAETLLKWATQRLMRYESRSGGRYRHLEDCAEDLDFMKIGRAHV